ncbi:hypothetical protein GCM10009544_56950 [Streptomyces stramineus]|uniref:DUF397 domain-containing protein n=1 Tax=Streptomyces stramineus TaxID=173861 RepID=A0ABN1B2C9_9ACTN
MGQEPRQRGGRQLCGVGELPEGAVAVRNSRHPQGPALVYTREEVAAFLDGAKNAEFDHLIM